MRRVPVKNCLSFPTVFVFPKRLTILHCFVFKSANVDIWSLQLSLAIRLAAEKRANFPDATEFLYELWPSNMSLISASVNFTATGALHDEAKALP